MKKILFIIALFCGFVANSQTPAGYTTINSRYDWLAGLFKALGLPAGGTAAFTAGQAQRAGSVYYDSTGSNAGFYIYTGTAWVLQGTPSAVGLPNELLAGGSVTPQGTGFNMSVQEAVYRINGTIYGSDSGTVTLSGSDPSLNRIDYIYLGTDGAFHVLEGIPGLPAAEPRLENDQLGIAFVSIPAGSTTPGVSTLVIYDENTESIVSNVGTTTDADNTAAGTVFTGAKSVEVTNINQNDRVIFTALVTFNAAGADALAIHLKPKAVLSANNNLYVQLFVGSTAVSNEVLISYNKANTTSFTAVSIPMPAFGTLTNYNITSVRIRYVGTVTVFAGFYFDYIFFQTGTSQPNPPGGGGFPNIIPPATWGVSGNGTQNITITAPALRDKDMRGDGTAEDDSSVKYVGALDGQAKNSNGGSINGNTYYNQTSDDSNPGINSALRHRQIDTLLAQTVEPGGGGDSLVYAIDLFRTGIKDLVAGSNITITPTDTTLVIASTGGGGSQTLQQVFDTEVGGSILTKNDTILNDYTLRMIGNSAVAFGDLLSIVNSSTTGRALNLQSAGTNATIQAVNTKTTSGGGSAIYASAVGSNAAASLNRDSSSTATVVKVLDINRTTSGTAADGIGTSIHFNIENQSGSGFYANSIESIWKNSIDASKESMLRIRGVDNVVEKVFMDIQKGGVVIVNDGADTLATKAYARSVGGGGGSGTVTNVATGYGVSGGPITTTGTLTADTASGSGLVSKDRLAAEIALIDTSNILINRGGDGAGQQSHWIVGDTALFLKDFKNSNSVLWSTDDDSNLIAKVDTFVIATKDRILEVADSLAAAITAGAGDDTYTINVFAGTYTAPADAATVFFTSQVATPTTTATFYNQTALRNCTITGASIDTRSATAGTGEAWSIYIRVNDATDYLIATVSSAAQLRTWQNASLNISLTAGDKWVIKMVNPTWATEPATVVIQGHVEFTK